METYGDRGLETVKHMFGFCQHSGGLYYGVPNDTTAAGELKRSAAEAQGKKESELLKLEEFFARFFG